MSDNENNELDGRALKDACRKLGLLVLLENEKDFEFEDTREGRDRAVDSIAKFLVSEAQGYATQLANRKRDSNVVTWALRYLANAHAFSRHKASIERYAAMLEVLMEIVLQDVKKVKEDLPLIDEMQHGLYVGKRGL